MYNKEPFFIQKAEDKSREVYRIPLSESENTRIL